jgi:hypothetical protein
MDQESGTARHRVRYGGSGGEIMAAGYVEMNSVD